MEILGYEYIHKLLKPLFKSRQYKIALKQTLTLTLKLGVTLVLTVTQVYVFFNLCQVTSAATLKPLGSLQLKVSTTKHGHPVLIMHMPATLWKLPTSSPLTAEAHQPTASVVSVSPPHTHQTHSDNIHSLTCQYHPQADNNPTDKVRCNVTNW